MSLDRLNLSSNFVDSLGSELHEEFKEQFENVRNEEDEQRLYSKWSLGVELTDNENFREKVFKIKYKNIMEDVGREDLDEGDYILLNNALKSNLELPKIPADVTLDMDLLYLAVLMKNRDKGIKESEIFEVTRETINDNYKQRYSYVISLIKNELVPKMISKYNEELNNTKHTLQELKDFEDMLRDDTGDKKIEVYRKYGISLGFDMILDWISNVEGAKDFHTLVSTVATLAKWYLELTYSGVEMDCIFTDNNSSMITRLGFLRELAKFNLKYNIEYFDEEIFSLLLYMLRKVDYKQYFVNSWRGLMYVDLDYMAYIYSYYNEGKIDLETFINLVTLDREGARFFRTNKSIERAKVDYKGLKSTRVTGKKVSYYDLLARAYENTYPELNDKIKYLELYNTSLNDNKEDSKTLVCIYRWLTRKGKSVDWVRERINLLTRYDSVYDLAKLEDNKDFEFRKKLWETYMK